ncbi:endonuclease domain-containing protein [Glaciimonas sp. PCH181]|uniref:endonuclease domain-containing protein n=1 Tax=Glaciimonas sp. PCH181 TaxID=2133943 RepID=UPI00351AA130
MDRGSIEGNGRSGAWRHDHDFGHARNGLCASCSKFGRLYASRESMGKRAAHYSGCAANA